MTALPADADDSLDATIAAIEPFALNRMNADFEDSVLLVGRVLGGRPDATSAEITAIDRDGVQFTATDPHGTHRGRIEFTARITSPMELQGELFSLMLRARAQSGEEGITSGEREIAETATIRTFITKVSAVEQVHPHLRQVTLAGGDLTTFSPIGPDTFVYVLLPPPGRTDLTIDRDFAWTQVETMPEADRPVGAYYTVRHWRPDTAELTLLFVLHDDAGPASSWVATAQPGDPVALWGPRTAYYPPSTSDWHLLVADETGLPAVAVILESLPDGATARVFAEVANKAERQDLPDGPGFEVTWLYRDGAAPGTTTLLADAVRAMPWPDGTPYVWGGGESRTMTAVRKYVRGELGLAREAVSLVAYWRHADSPLED